MVTRWPLMLVIKRCLVHDETNHPCRHGATFRCYCDSYALAAPRLVRGRHLPERTGAMIQWAEGVGTDPAGPWCRLSSAFLRMTRRTTPAVTALHSRATLEQRLGLYGVGIYRSARAR